MSGRVDAELLEILVCPQCKGGLELRSDTDAHVALECGVCALAYPVDDGIPVMLVEEARPLSAKAAES